MTLDKSGNVTFCNDFLLRLTGWTRAEVIGNPWFDRFLPPSAAEEKKLFLDTIDAGSIPAHQQGPLQMKMGRSRQILWNTRCFGMTGGTSPASPALARCDELSRVEMALAESEAQFRQVVENIREEFWMADATNYRMLYLSPSYEVIWGRPRERLYGAPSPGSSPSIRKTGARPNTLLVTSKLAVTTTKPTALRGPTAWCAGFVTAHSLFVTEAGRVLRVVGTAEDITEYRTLEEHSHQAQKMEALGTLAGGIAHDFNNILAAISGYTELALMDAEGQSGSARGSQRRVEGDERATDLVAQILAFSRQQQLERRPIQLQPSLRKASSCCARPCPRPSSSTHRCDGCARRARRRDPDPPGPDEPRHQRLARDEGPAGPASCEAGAVCGRCGACGHAAAAAAGRLRALSVGDTGCGMDRRRCGASSSPSSRRSRPAKAPVWACRWCTESWTATMARSPFTATRRGYGLSSLLPRVRRRGVAAAEEEAVPRGNGERVLLVDDEELLIRAKPENADHARLRGRGRDGAGRSACDGASQSAALCARAHGPDHARDDRPASPASPGIRPGLPIILMTGYNAAHA